MSGSIYAHTIRFDAEVGRELKRIASIRKRSVSKVVNDLVLNVLRQSEPRVYVGPEAIDAVVEALREKARS